jgi:peptidoglycan/LPS O-acetylase OafA/YrhL
MRPGALNASAPAPTTRAVDRALAPVLRLLPSAEGVGARRRRAAALTTAVLMISLAAHVAYAALGADGSDPIERLVDGVCRQLVMAAAVVLCALRVGRDDPDRGAWLALAIGLGLWVAGQSYWNAVPATSPDPPIPSPADAGWLAF